MVVNCAVANELHLRHTGDCFEVRVEDRLLGALSLVVPVAIVLRFGIECLVGMCLVADVSRRGDLCGPW